MSFCIYRFTFCFQSVIQFSSYRNIVNFCFNLSMVFGQIVYLALALALTPWPLRLSNHSPTSVLLMTSLNLGWSMIEWLCYSSSCIISIIKSVIGTKHVYLNNLIKIQVNILHVICFIYWNPHLKYKRIYYHKSRVFQLLMINIDNFMKKTVKNLQIGIWVDS